MWLGQEIRNQVNSCLAPQHVPQISAAFVFLGKCWFPCQSRELESLGGRASPLQTPIPYLCLTTNHNASCYLCKMHAKFFLSESYVTLTHLMTWITVFCVCMCVFMHTSARFNFCHFDTESQKKIVLTKTPVIFKAQVSFTSIFLFYQYFSFKMV